MILKIIKGKNPLRANAEFAMFAIKINSKRKDDFMRKAVVVFIVALSLSQVFADYFEANRKHAVGLGFGIDYGGIGLKYTYHPIDYLGIFAGVGSNLVGLGFNFGIKGDIIQSNSFNMMRVSAHLMYGYNAVTMVVGKSEYNKTFYGLTPGIGVGFRFGQKRSHGLDFGLQIPIRGQDFTDQMNLIKSDPQVTIGAVSPVAISIGYTWEM